MLNEKKNTALLFILVGLILSGCKANTISSMDDTTEKSSITSSKPEEITIPSTEASALPSEQMNPVQDYLDSFNDQNIGIYIEKIDSNEIFGVNEEKVFYGASIAKLPIIFYTQEALKNQSYQDDTFFTYMDEVNDIPGAMIRSGTGIMQYQIEQQNTFSLQQLLEWTIVHSDNLASNTLSYYVANQNDAAFLKALEPYYTFEQSEFTKNMNAHTAANLMKAIYENNIRINYFLETDWKNEKIGILDKKVYHKIGTNEGFNHDVAIVDGDEPYVLSILSEDFSNDAIEAIVKKIDRLIEEDSSHEKM